MSDSQDAVFRALADRHRRKILAALCEGPQVAGELARLVELAPNAVSFHLKWLKTAGLVSIRREGRYLHYHANADTLNDWRRHVSSALTPAETDARTSTFEPAHAFPDDPLPTELL